MEIKGLPTQISVTENFTEIAEITEITGKYGHFSEK